VQPVSPPVGQPVVSRRLSQRVADQHGCQTNWFLYTRHSRISRSLVKCRDVGVEVGRMRWTSAELSKSKIGLVSLVRCLLEVD